MNLNIEHKKDNPFLSRTEVAAEIIFTATTPSNAEVTKQLAALMKVEPALVKIRKINNLFGSKKAKVEAVVYKSLDALNYVERKSRKQRRTEKEAALADKKAKAEGKAAEGGAAGEAE